MKIKFEHEIDDARIGDLLSCALGGGSGYWIGRIKAENPDKEPSFKYHSDLLNAERGALIIEDKFGDEGPKLIDRKAIEQGLQIMADQYPWHFKNFIDENEDAETGDVFLQCCAFEGLVYG